ncbi:unnamed protein product [Echinostoma caproni]|uniref:Uncharacterized protein n=1 Tax=Echinostoma caproni TaxID=27848 RepID=A0A183BEW2_9TREM|nr:unnamed protein product [Echinostoma caproni]
MDEKLKMRTAVNLTRLQIDEAPHISAPKQVKNLSFIPLVASTPDASFADTTSDDSTIVGIINYEAFPRSSKGQSPNQGAHFPITSWDEGATT